MPGLSGLALLIFVTGCVKSGAYEVSEQEETLSQADRALEIRGVEGSVDAAIQLYLAALVGDPLSIRARAGLAQAYALREWSSGTEDFEGYRVGREQGLQCLLQDPVFSARVRSEGGRLTVEALDRVSDSRWECLYWAGWAWLRWIEERGTAAMSMDHDIVLALTERVLELAPRSDRGRALGLHGQALALNDDRQVEAEEAFKRAIALRGGDLVLELERVICILLPDGRLDEAQSRLERITAYVPDLEDPGVLENREAAMRAARLLDDLLQAEARSPDPGVTAD